MTEKYITWGNVSVMRHSKAMISDIMEENQQLKEQIKELEKENKQLQIEVLGQSEEIEILSDENKRLKQGKYIYGVHGGSND